MLQMLYNMLIPVVELYNLCVTKLERLLTANIFKSEPMPTP